MQVLVCDVCKMPIMTDKRYKMTVKQMDEANTYVCDKELDMCELCAKKAFGGLLPNKEN